MCWGYRLLMAHLAKDLRSLSPKLPPVESGGGWSVRFIIFSGLAPTIRCFYNMKCTRVEALFSMRGCVASDGRFHRVCLGWINIVKCCKYCNIVMCVGFQFFRLGTFFSALMKCYDPVFGSCTLKGSCEKLIWWILIRPILYKYQTISA